MIRLCKKQEFEQIYAIFNDGALAYKGALVSRSRALGQVYKLQLLNSGFRRTGHCRVPFELISR